MAIAIRSHVRLTGSAVGAFSGILISLSGLLIAGTLGRGHDFEIIGLLMAAGALVAGALFAPGALAGRRRMVGRGALFALLTIVGAGLITVLWTLVAGVDPVDPGGIILQIVAWFSAIGIMAGVIWILLLRAIAKGNLRLGVPALATAFALMAVTVMIESLVFNLLY